MSKENPTDEEILAKADRVAKAGAELRGKGDDAGADRAEDAAAQAREYVRQQRLARTEADNYARGHEPQQTEE